MTKTKTPALIHDRNHPRVDKLFNAVNNAMWDAVRDNVATARITEVLAHNAGFLIGTMAISPNHACEWSRHEGQHMHDVAVDVAGDDDVLLAMFDVKSGTKLAKCLLKLRNATTHGKLAKHVFGSNAKDARANLETMLDEIATKIMAAELPYDLATIGRGADSTIRLIDTYQVD